MFKTILRKYFHFENNKTDVREDTKGLKESSLEMTSMHINKGYPKSN